MCYICCVPKRSKDLLFVRGPTDDGGGVHVVRARPERLEVGTMRPLEDGRPIDGEVVRVNPHPEWPCLYEVETEFTPAKPDAGVPESPPAAKAVAKPLKPAAAARPNGPPQVASDAYRKNWDVIWNRPAKRRPVLN